MAEPVKLYNGGVYLVDGKTIISEESVSGVMQDAPKLPNPDVAREGTIAYGILAEHNTSGDMARLRLRFDALASHDITYVGVIQTAKASGMTEFPVPYVLTNCHNTLCAVGGTINEDDHVFGLSAAKKYGGIFVPPHIAVITRTIMSLACPPQRSTAASLFRHISPSFTSTCARCRPAAAR